MQTIITYLANIVAIISLRAIVSYQALRVYGGLLLLVGCVIGHVALILLGIACLYFGLRERDEQTESRFGEPSHNNDEKAEQS